MRFIFKNFYFSLLLLVLTFLIPSSYGFSLKSLAKASEEDLKNVKADHWSISGNNIIVKGNVVVPLGEYDVFADSAVINVKSRDIDVTGNVQLYRKEETTLTLSPSQFAELENKPGMTLELTGIKTDVFGTQTFSVKSTSINGTIKANTVSGNMNTGFFQFKSAILTMGNLVFRADSGERQTNGIIRIKNAEVSSCGYLVSQNAHYSVSMGSAEITPYDTMTFGTGNAITRSGEYSIFGTNCAIRLYGVPVFWLPVFYKPKDENLGLFQIQGGKDSDWGYYLLMSKKFNLLDYPDSSIRVMADFYDERGFGYGASVISQTENSKTTIFAYGIHDRNPYKYNEADKYGLNIGKQRYDFRISNLTHITPTLDFRGNFEIMSDEFINEDFFSDYYDANPRPVTFAALEKQFDLFSASIYVRPKVNKFFNVVEQLPTARIDIPRQEIFDTNIYYQGETSFGYYKRNWAEYDWADEKYTASDFQDYETGRFDTLHFFYYPIKLDFLNIVPRAGFRITAYTQTSKNAVTDDDLAKMFASNVSTSYGTESFNSYDDNGGSKVRFAGEVGLEMNTKIYNSWQNIRSSFWQLDGLRHVIIPYLNYTYIPKPTLSRENIYYFDDIDRIEKQNFLRLGIINRLSTRSKGKIVNYMTMENYWDYHFEPEEGYSHVGDFCTKITAKTPIEGLTLATFFSIGLSNNDDFTDEDQEITREGYNAGHPGLYLNWLNRLSFEIRYEPVKDYVMNLSYQYQNKYGTQSTYSMGSSLTDIESGSAFDKVYTDQTQTIVFGLSFPITPDRRTFGKYAIEYDFNAGFVTAQCFGVIRKFHCIEVAAELEIEKEIEDNKKETNISFYVIAQLTGLMGPADNVQNHLISSARNMQSRD